MDAFTARLGHAQRIPLANDDWIGGPYAIPGNAYLPASIPIYIGKLATVVPDDRILIPQPNNGHRMTTAKKHSVPVDIPFGATLIKLNVHPQDAPAAQAGGPDRS